MLTPIALITGAGAGHDATRGWGRVVNITSQSVKAPIPQLGLSNAARAGLTGYVAGTARQVAAKGVTINNLLPGIHATDRADVARRRRVGRPRASRWKRPRRGAAPAIPAGRYGTAEEFGADLRLPVFATCRVHRRAEHPSGWRRGQRDALKCGGRRRSADRGRNRGPARGFRLPSLPRRNRSAGMTSAISLPIGPLLFLDAVADGRLHLSALFILEPGAEPAAIEVRDDTVPAVRLARFDRADVWRTRFTLPANRPSVYDWNGTRFAVAADLGGDLRLAFVSCNGEEHGDLARDGGERNALWARLCAEHRDRPFALLLHGGDQVYADEVTAGHPLSDGWPGDVPDDPSPEALADLRRHLREGFFARYAAVCSAPEMGWLMARVPSLMQWDDHDICDGWGSLPRRSTTSAVGRTLYAAAHEAALLFQHASTADDMPPRCADASGAHLGWAVHMPGLRILAPDLRAERTRRQVMGRGGWAFMEDEAARVSPGLTLLMSSVPLLGPRLSLLEALMVAIPSMQKYEDDLRDQWQSRAHRDEWRRMLRLVRDMAAKEGQSVTAVSGEIHLATRAEMQLGEDRVLHQLVASGIAHRAPPKAWARTLGTLASLGEAPLHGHPIRIRPLPGQGPRYVAERNYLLIERANGHWSARWHLEDSGTTPPLALGDGPG